MAETRFERETLYGEIWREPVSTVAKRYGVSDVALRKICTKLAVPIPPLGHWAKTAAGHVIEIPSLPTNHKGPTVHVRYCRDDPERDERESRVSALLAADPIPNVTPELKTAIGTACLRFVARLDA